MNKKCNIPSVSNNVFSDPAIDIPRIADALATEVKSGHMAGPLPMGSIKDAKVNGFMSVVKPGDARRQVGNLSSPKGASFNEVYQRRLYNSGECFRPLLGNSL